MKTTTTALVLAMLALTACWSGRTGPPTAKMIKRTTHRNLDTEVTYDGTTPDGDYKKPYRFPGTEFPTKAEYTLTITDRPENEMFWLTMTSKSDRQICMAYSSWPFYGISIGDEEVVFVETADRVVTLRYRPQAFQIFRRGSSRYLQIPPGKSIDAYLPYSEFEPELLDYSPQERRLIFLREPFFCREY